MSFWQCGLRVVLRGPHGRDGWSPLWAGCGQVPCGRSRPRAEPLQGRCAGSQAPERPLLGLCERTEAQPAFPQPPVCPRRLPSQLHVPEPLSLNNPGPLLTFLLIPTPASHQFYRGRNSKTVLNNKSHKHSSQPKTNISHRTRAGNRESGIRVGDWCPGHRSAELGTASHLEGGSVT